MEETNSGELSAVETAYFESGGEKPLTEEAPIQEQAKVETSPEKVEAKTEETAEQKAERERDEKTGRFVPHGALHAEREERKKVQAERDELLQFKAAMQERFRIAEAQKAANEPQSDDPFADVEPDDFIGKVDRIADLIRQERQQKATTEKQTAEQQQAESTYQQHFAYVERHFNDAATTDPQFADATQAVINSYGQELEALGYRGEALARASENTRRNFIFAASNALQQGVPIADFITGIAKLRGWQPKAPEPKKDEIAEKLDGIEKAQEQSRTIGAASGKASGDPDTLESIMAMSKSEFEVWHAEPKNARRFEKLMGA